MNTAKEKMETRLTKESAELEKEEGELTDKIAEETTGGVYFGDSVSETRYGPFMHQDTFMDSKTGQD